MIFKRKKLPAVMDAEPSSVWFHKPIPLCPLERSLIEIAIQRNGNTNQFNLDEIFVVERNYTVVGSYSRLITLAKNEHMYVETTLSSANFGFDDIEVSAGSIVYLGVDGIDCIEMFSHDSKDFPEDFNQRKFRILED